MTVWYSGERSIDLVKSGLCPLCEKPMIIGPRTILSLKVSASHRHAYENYDCRACNVSIAWLIKDPLPAGIC